LLRIQKRKNRCIWQLFICKGMPSPSSSDGTRKLAPIF
jgi:hypothetical protein